MKKSISTFLKHPTKDNTNRSANPPIARASTILFNTMGEMEQHSGSEVLRIAQATSNGSRPLNRHIDALGSLFQKTLLEITVSDQNFVT